LNLIITLEVSLWALSPRFSSLKEKEIKRKINDLSKKTEPYNKPLRFLCGP